MNPLALEHALIAAARAENAICEREGCSEPLAGKGPRARFCSSNCRKRKDQPRDTTVRTCERDGCETLVTGKRAGARYCSHNCRKRANEHLRYRTPCECCGKPTAAHPRITRCRACFAHDERARREVKLSLVEGMWADGWSQRDISDVFGWSYVPGGQVGVIIDELRKQGRAPKRYRDSFANDEERREVARVQSRAYKRKHRAVCETCGGECGIGSGDHGTRRCMTCVQTQARATEDTLEALWAEGHKVRDIASMLGYTEQGVWVVVLRLRKQGRAPYRKGPYQVPRG